MKKQNWEENLISGAQQSSVTPPPAAWDNIASALDKKERKKPFIWFLVLGVLVASSAGFVYMNNNKTKAINLEKKVENKFVANNNSNEFNQKEIVEINTELNELNNKQNSKNTDLKRATNFTEKSVQLSINSSISSLNKSQFNSKSNKINKVIEAAKINHSGLVKEDNYRSNKPTEIFSENKNKPTSDKEILFEKSGNNPIAFSALNYQENLKEKNANQPNINTERSEVNMNYLNDKNIILTLKDLRLKPVRLNMKNVECYSFNKKRIQPFIELEGGLGIPFRTLSPNNEEGKLFDNKLAAEKTWYAFNIGLYGGLILRNNMTVSAGINYTEFREKFDHTITGITQIIIDFDPVTNTPTDTTVKTGSTNYSVKNHLQLINIPVKIGYQKNMKNWILAGEIGAAYNLNLTAKGKVLNGDQKIYDLEDRTDIYRKSVGFTYSAGIAMHYLLNDNLSIYLKPQYVGSFSDWTLENSSIKLSYDALNVNVGVRKSFGKSKK